MSDHFDSDEFTAHPFDENPMNVSESAVLRWMNRALNAEAALRKAQPTAEPVAWLFTVHETVGGRKAAVTFAAIDWVPAPEDGRVLISKEPLYAAPQSTAEAVRSLEADVEALRKDAERYRWLRTAGAWESEIGMNILAEEPASFDAAVDAAMGCSASKAETP